MTGRRRWLNSRHFCRLVSRLCGRTKGGLCSWLQGGRKSGRTSGRFRWRGRRSCWLFGCRGRSWLLGCRSLSWRCGCWSRRGRRTCFANASSTFCGVFRGARRSGTDCNCRCAELTAVYLLEVLGLFYMQKIEKKNYIRHPIYSTHRHPCMIAVDTGSRTGLQIHKIRGQLHLRRMLCLKTCHRRKDSSGRHTRNPNKDKQARSRSGKLTRGPAELGRTL